MKKYLNNLKTSEKISLSFSLFSFLMLVILLITINITYFFIWYNDQKNQSFYDMERNYSQSYLPNDTTEAESFQAFLLQSDTLIIPAEWEPICSDGVLTKIHNDVDELTDKLFYVEGDILYFVYSRFYEGIGEVKVFFDTTTYISTQLIIIKISLVTIFIAFFLHFFVGKLISRRLLRDLKGISQQLQWIDLDSKLERIPSHGPADDEIQILAQTLNKSFEKIENQTKNLKQFITDVSHEFKTPLMSINSKIDLNQKKIEAGKMTPWDEQDFLDYVKNQTKRLNVLLETLFLLSRFEENIQKFTCSTTEFSTYLEEKCRNFFENYPHIEVKMNVAPGIHFCIEDTTCNIIIENLLTNAVKFADPDNPVIEIWCDKKSFWVSDNGIGMSPEQVSHITDKFYKSDRNKEGFGIGLFLVNRIVKIYEWEIKFSSKVWKWTKVQIIFK